MSNNSTKQGDRYQRKPIAIAPIPEAPNTILAASFTVSPGSVWTINSTVQPGFNSLSLWDFLWSAFVDVDNDENYRFATGSALVGEQWQDLYVILDHVDFYESDDVLNTRFQEVSFKNEGASPHTIYFYIKAYTFAVVTGDLS